MAGARFEAEAQVGCFRLIELLGSGGFAEVWRARPEPAQAGGLPPSAQLGVARVLAALAGKAGADEAGRLLTGAADGLELIERTPGAPAEVRATHRGLLAPLLGWLEAPAAAGDLDLALKLPFHDGYVRQLRREDDLLRHVSHPNLVEQYHLDAANEPPYLAMELVQGTSLRDALRSEPLPPMKKILAVMDQLLTVLDHLHRRGMVHGDVKPENVLMERDGTLRLIDLGLARVSQQVMRDTYLSLSLASRVPLLGTLSYMAPEVRRGDPPQATADLYAAGIVLYEMLCGDVPTGMTPPSEAAKHRGLTSRFDVLLRWVLHPEPERRIASAAEMRERVLVALNPRDRYAIGSGVRAQPKPRDGTRSFDAWALEQASPFVAGDWVGDFQLLDPLGRGGFGEVWRARIGPWARPGEPEREVALKLAIGPGGRDGLVREAEVGGRLHHPSIPAVIEQHLDHDPPFLAVDLVRGESLRVRLNERGRMEVDEVVSLIRSLGEAVGHCHEHGVIHCDLKPENLLVDPESGSVHLLDFGLATTDAPEVPQVHLSDGLKTGDASGGGTFEYLPPERRRGEAPGPPADVYSAGVILFEALTLQLPRGLTRLRELCGAPRALEALCEAMLNPDPASRPTPAEVVQRLDVIRPRERIFGARRRRERTRRIQRRARRWIAPAAAAGLAAAGGLGLALLVGQAGRGFGRAAAREAEPGPVTALAARVARLDPEAPVEELAEKLAAERALHTALTRVPLKPAGREALRDAGLELGYLEGWLEAHQEARRIAGRAVWRLAELRRDGPAQVFGPASVEEVAREVEVLRQLDERLSEALRLAPLAEAVPAWEVARGQARARRAVQAEALRAGGPAVFDALLAAGDTGGAALVALAIEQALPLDPAVDALYERLAAAGPAVGQDRREQLARNLLNRGDPGAAWAVANRAPGAPLEALLGEIEAVSVGVDLRLQAYREVDAGRALELLEQAQERLPFDAVLAQEVSGRRAAAEAGHVPPSEARQRARTWLWTAGADLAAVASYAQRAAEHHRWDRELGRIAQVARALAGGTTDLTGEAAQPIEAWRTRHERRQERERALSARLEVWVAAARRGEQVDPVEQVRVLAEGSRQARAAEEQAARQVRRLARAGTTRS